MAVWMASMAKDLPGKIVAIWFPISAFVALGLEHSVANMFIVPLGMMHGARYASAPTHARAQPLPSDAPLTLRSRSSYAHLTTLLPSPSAVAGAPVTWSAFLLNNLLPVTLGNIVGGAVCVAGAFSYAYGALGGK